MRTENMTDDHIKAFMRDRWKVGDFMDRGQEPCSMRDLRALVEAAVAAERERWIAICKERAADPDPPHKPHEETYADGWLDACNEIMWAGEKA